MMSICIAVILAEGITMAKQNTRVKENKERIISLLNFKLYLVVYNPAALP